MKSIERAIKLYIGIDWSYVFDWPRVNPDSTKDDLMELMEDMQEKLLAIEGRISLKSLYSDLSPRPVNSTSAFRFLVLSDNIFSHNLQAMFYTSMIATWYPEFLFVPLFKFRNF